MASVRTCDHPSHEKAGEFETATVEILAWHDLPKTVAGREIYKRLDSCEQHIFVTVKKLWGEDECTKLDINSLFRAVVYCPHCHEVVVGYCGCKASYIERTIERRYPARG